MAREKNKQVILVAPTSMYWYSALMGAVNAETGLYPYLVQTERQRTAIGNSGSTRILDGAALFRQKENDV